MPKAKNMVKWCLNKAKEEIAKGEVHRGLIQIKPNDKLALDYIAKAEHNLDIQKVEELLGVCQDMLKDTKGIMA